MENKFNEENYKNKKYEEAIQAYNDLPERTKWALCVWIEAYIERAKICNCQQNSYHLKHFFEWHIGLGEYVSNEAFKGAMLAKKYLPQNPLERNWCYRIRQVKVNKKLLERSWNTKRDIMLREKERGSN